ncbi:MAG: sec-independent protein translocase protein TatA [Parasphingorhabdus sp.]|jgi:sec-independent protein translocase protein TatA
MGFGGISVWQLLIILVIVVLIFGTKKLRGMGGDMGSAIKSFKKAVKEDKSVDATATPESGEDVESAEQLSQKEATESEQEQSKAS